MVHRSTRGRRTPWARTNAVGLFAWHSERARRECPCRESGEQPSPDAQLPTPRYRLERTCSRCSRFSSDSIGQDADLFFTAILRCSVLWSLPTLSQASENLPPKGLASKLHVKLLLDTMRERVRRGGRVAG